MFSRKIAVRIAFALLLALFSPGTACRVINDDSESCRAQALGLSALTLLRSQQLRAAGETERADFLQSGAVLALLTIDACPDPPQGI